MREFVIVLTLGALIGFTPLGGKIGKEIQSLDLANLQGSVKVSYSPPLIPMTISADMNGEVQVSTGGKIITPIGTISVDLETERSCRLELKLGQSTNFYPLDKRPVKLKLPNSISNSSPIESDGQCNVRVMVPDPQGIHFPTS